MLPSLDVNRLKSTADAQHLTQAALARVSGVSRAQLARLFGRSEASVRPATLKRLADALGVDPTKLLVGGPIEAYRKLVAEKFAQVDFRGLGLARVKRQPIAEIYVDLPIRQAQESDDDCRRAESCAPASTSDPQQPILATQCVGAHDRVVLLGGPGSGKTTALRFLAHGRAASDDADREIPIYIRLPDLCRGRDLDQQVDPVKFVAAWAAGSGCPDVEPSLAKELADDNRPCLVLLDGLDEVGSEGERAWLIDCVRAFVDKYPRNRFAVTSRVDGFDSAPWRGLGFSVFQILPWREKELKAFAGKWVKILARDKNMPEKKIEKTLETAIFSNPRVRALATNPLILTLLVLLNEARGGTLPRRRVDLYEKVVDVFLETWERNKQSPVTLGDVGAVDLDAREFRWMLSDLALAMQKADLTIAARWWLAERIQGYLQQKLGFAPEEAKSVCDRIIRYLSERTGLIEERGPDLFGFSHRTLQEYFASLGIIDEADASSSRDVTSCLREYLFHPQWIEVVRLVAARLTPPVAESLLSTILDDPDPVGRFLRRGPLLALRCLSDGASLANRQLVAGVFDSLVDLGRSRWLGITLQAIDVLQSFEGTRWHKPAQESLTAILDTAEKHLDANEYGCLHGQAYLREIREAALEQLPPVLEAGAAQEAVVDSHGKECRIVFLNGALLTKEPRRWHSSANTLIEDPDQSIQLKETLVRELGRRVTTDRRARRRLRGVLQLSKDARLQVACVWALAGRTGGKRNAKSLLRVLDQDSDQKVRHACASALGDVAAADSSLGSLVRRRLMEIFQGDQPEIVRAGAARGLAKAIGLQPSVLEALYRSASLDREPNGVRIACAWALESQIGKDAAIGDTFRSWLEGSDVPGLQQVAAELLATATVDEKLAWDRGVVERIEHVLMNLDDPCPCAWQCLAGIAKAREVRRGLRLETVLRQSLEPTADQIEVAFVFGSTARNRQTEDSDIDLLVIGDVGLKELSSPLRQAERTLGRRINPAIYTRDSFREKYQAGNPFLADVYRREKIPVIQSTENLSQTELDHDLRAMVAERVASTE
ncbi:MAG: HEAT repeat domain-containing protein [Planctomycetes bacterium]|nr:HEAT repeat domain-containing protein [Planctomycetota bacterium]